MDIFSILFIILNPTALIYACNFARLISICFQLVNQLSLLKFVHIERISLECNINNLHILQNVHLDHTIQMWLHLTYKFSWETAVNQIINLNKPNVSRISVLCDDDDVHTHTHIVARFNLIELIQFYCYYLNYWLKLVVVSFKLYIWLES